MDSTAVSPPHQPVGFCKNLAHSVGSGLNRVWEAVKKVFVTIALVLSYPFRALWNYCFSQEQKKPILANSAVEKMVKDLTSALLDNITPLVKEPIRCGGERWPDFATKTWQHFHKVAVQSFKSFIEAGTEQIDIAKLGETIQREATARLREGPESQQAKNSQNLLQEDCFLSQLDQVLSDAWIWSLPDQEQTIEAAVEAIQATDEQKPLLKNLILEALEERNQQEAFRTSYCFTDSYQPISQCLQHVLFKPLFANGFSDIDGIKLLNGLYYYLPSKYRLSHKEFCDELNKAAIAHEQAAPSRVEAVQLPSDFWVDHEGRDEENSDSE